MLLPSKLEPHPTGTLNVNGIIQGNWDTINRIVDPAETGDLAGILEAALAGQAGITTITYGASVNVSLTARRLQTCALTGDITIAVTNKKAGRATTLILTADGTDRAVTWPAGVVWDGAAVTTVAASGKAIIEIIATGTTDASLYLRALPDLSAYVTSSALTTALSDYVETTTLSGYVTTSALTTALGDYVTETGAQDVSSKALLLVTRMTLASSAYVELTIDRPATDADNGKILWSAAGTDITLTIPDTLTKPWGCTLQQRAAGAIIPVGSGTANVVNFDSHTKTAGQWAGASLDWPEGNDIILMGRTA